MQDHNADTMQAIKTAIYRERQQKLLLLCLILLSVILLGWGSSFQKEEALANIMVVSAIAALLSALLFIRDIMRFWKPESSPILQMMHFAPKNIVWIYVVQVNIAPFGIRLKNEQTICLRLMNGDILQIRFPKKELQSVLNGLAELLPHATFGFDKAKEQLYRIHPSLLYRD